MDCLIYDKTIYNQKRRCEERSNLYTCKSVELIILKMFILRNYIYLFD